MPSGRACSKLPPAAAASAPLPPTWTISRSPKMTGVLPTPKKFFTTPKSADVSTFQIGLPVRASMQCNIPSAPKV